MATLNQEINDLQNKIIEGTRVCVQDIITDALKLVEEISSKVQAIKEKAMELLNKIKACSINVTCLAQVFQEAIEFLKSINIDAIIEQVHNIIGDVNGEVSVCIVNQAELFNKGTIQIQENVKTCIQNILS